MDELGISITAESGVSGDGDVAKTDPPSHRIPSPVAGVGGARRGGGGGVWDPFYNFTVN